MLFGLFRRSANEAVIERLHAAIVEAARQPVLYLDLGMVDTFEGRFESLTLHAALVLRRLNALPAPAPDMAQDLADTIFRHFDRTLREMGVGDTTVPKKMKGLAEAFMGRSAAYDEALRGNPKGSALDHDHLAKTLARNILGRRDVATGSDNAPLEARTIEALTLYVEAVAEALGDTPTQAFVDGRVPFPDPARFGPEGSP
jgi:cytochrome b pre-mRNA-processing protein 3